MKNFARVFAFHEVLTSSHSSLIDTAAKPSDVNNVKFIRTCTNPQLTVTQD